MFSQKELDYSLCVSVFDLYLKDDGDAEQFDPNFGHSWMHPLREKDYDQWKSAELLFASEHVRRIKGLHAERGDARLAPQLGQSMFVIVAALASTCSSRLHVACYACQSQPDSDFITKSHVKDAHVNITCNKSTF